MRNKPFLAALLLFAPLLLFLTCSSQPAKTLESYIGLPVPQDTLDRYLAERMEELAIPGLAVAVINEGRVVYHRTLGYANREQELPVTEQTIFEAASMSKSLFAFFVMTYVEAGQLDLDRPLYEYLPNPAIAHDERYHRITARMALSHRTGFPNWRTDQLDSQLVLQFDPGTDYFYSGEGYQYLAEVLKEIDGTDWAGLDNRFQERVARPLGLEHTGFLQDTYASANKAEPYDENGAWIAPQNDRDSLLRKQFIAPASVHTEARDFAKWMIALMNREGLTDASYAELFHPHSLVEATDFYDVNYTLGFFHPEIPLTNLYLHGGNNYGFTAWFALDTQKKWGFVVFTNSEYGEQLGNELLFYLLIGPDRTRLYLWLFALLVLFGTGVYYLLRRILRWRRARVTG